MIQLNYWMVTVLILGVLCFGCTSKEESDSESTEKNTLESFSEAAEKMQKTAEEFVESSGQDMEPVPAVSFKLLMNFLPTEYAGLIPGEPEGESTSFMNWNYSTASIKLQSEDRTQRMEVEIFDYAYITLMYAPYKMMLNMKFNKESSKGYERSTQIGGFPGFESWEIKSLKNEVNVLVGKRYIVSAKSYGLPEGTARSVVENMGLGKLANLEAV